MSSVLADRDVFQVALLSPTYSQWGVFNLSIFNLISVQLFQTLFMRLKSIRPHVSSISTFGPSAQPFTMPEFISTPTSMDGLSYHDFASRPYDHFHGPPPATDVMVPALFSTHHGFSFTPYPTTPLGMGPGLHDSRPLSEPFSLFPRGSFGGPDTSPSSSGAPTTPTAVTPPYAGKKTDRIVKPNDINPKAKAKRTSYVSSLPFPSTSNSKRKKKKLTVKHCRLASNAVDESKSVTAPNRATPVKNRSSTVATDRSHRLSMS